MKIRIVVAITCGVLLSSSALAQAPSRFDLTGNLSFNGATLPTAPSSTQVRAFGWQTSGVTHFSRWFGVTSQFASGYASADSIQLIGYTGPGKMIHYSMLVGPRITLPARGRFSPFIEGLAGVDRASTSLVSNGTPVTGREWQTAYAFGGGAQINLSRYFGLNFEGQYFGTQHTTAFTGWEPSHLQIAAGIVIRMPSRGPQIAEARPVPTLPTVATPEPGSEPNAAPGTANEVSTTSAVTAIPTIVSMPAESLAVEPKFAVVPVAVQPVAVAKVPSSGSVVMNGTRPSTLVRQTSESTPPLVTPAPQNIASVPPVNASQVPAQSFAQIPPPAVTSARAIVPQTLAQPRSEAPPISLGEYARRLREKKQQQLGH